MISVTSRRRVGSPPREPKVSYGRHRARDVLDLREGHVAGLVELFMIETGLTKRITARSDKQNHSAEPLLTIRGAEKLHQL